MRIAWDLFCMPHVLLDTKKARPGRGEPYSFGGLGDPRRYAADASREDCKLNSWSRY